MRRLHSRMLGWGSLCGLPSSPLSEVLLKGLPPPSEANPAKYSRFKREETFGLSSTEPFYDFIDVAAGAKHFGLVTREGNVVLMGNNRYGQVGQPTQTQTNAASESIPYFYDLAFTTTAPSTQEEEEAVVTKKGDRDVGTIPSAASPTSVVCGCNFTIFYRRGGISAYGVGNNHHGQLGLGHKDVLDNRMGLAGWPADAPWILRERELLLRDQEQEGEGARSTEFTNRLGIANIVCGFNHTIIQMLSGRLYACGTNLWGELGIGNTTAPMWPTEIIYFRTNGIRVVQVAAGSSFTLFLSSEGRVYGCGATNFGQLPPNTFDPTPVPLVRLDTTEARQHPKKNFGKLIRIKHIACVADAAVYVTSKNEVLLQGSFPELGLCLHHPKYRVLELPDDPTDNVAVVEEEEDRTVKRRRLHKDIIALHSGPNIVIVECRDGSLYAIGCNLDGQITAVTRRHDASKLGMRKKVEGGGTNAETHPPPQRKGGGYAAAAFLDAMERLPIRSNKSTTVSSPKDTIAAPCGEGTPRFAISASGCLLLDHTCVFGDEHSLRSARPIDLPQGASLPTTTSSDRRGGGHKGGEVEQRTSPGDADPRVLGETLEGRVQEKATTLEDAKKGPVHHRRIKF